jgi:diacylglycerol kinase (ATP)
MIAIVHNPSARKGAATEAMVREWAPRIAPGAVLTWHALTELKEFPVDTERLIAIGGDGTVNATVEWAYRAGHNCPIAIVPAGTGNNLAKAVGLDLPLAPALRVALCGQRIRQVEAILIRADDGREKLMVQSGALGFAARVAMRYDHLRTSQIFRLLARPLGTQIYRLMSALRVLRLMLRPAPQDALDVRWQIGNGGWESVHALGFFIGNDDTLGGDFSPCPLALMDDGLIDICALPAMRGTALLKLFRQVVRGEHLAHPGVVYGQTADEIKLELSRPEPLLIDGDVWCELRSFSLRALPGHLRLVVGDC